MSLRRPRFRASAENVPSEPGTWKTSVVSVFDGETLIGKYERNHAGWAEETFDPFEWEGAWYALYSPDYTTTRVMSLPNCRDIGGEEPDGSGFCPVEFFVPWVRAKTVRLKGKSYESLEFCNDQRWPTDPAAEVTEAPWSSIDTGFVAGCIWGDDYSWKLQCIDMAEAAKGRVVRTERFGFVELAPKLSLRDSLRFDAGRADQPWMVHLIRQEARDLASGALLDPYDL